jgi:RimJ/RimL family protein N-acetyltransferase
MILQTDRLILQPQAQADAPALFAILSDPDAMRFWNRPAISRLAVVEELVREQQAAAAQGLCRYWTVIRGGSAIGSVDLSLIQDGSAEMGFLLRPDHWGMGLASEAVGAVVAHGLTALGLTRLAAVAQTENRAAARVLKKTGFIFVEARPVLLADGQKKDCAFYLRTAPSA